MALFETENPHFATDYIFKGATIASSAQTSGAVRLGEALGGIGIRAWVDGKIACTAADTVVVELQTSADGTSFSAYKSATTTATGTALSGDLFFEIPETDAEFIRVKVTGATGMTGKFSVAPEYIPR